MKYKIFEFRSDVLVFKYSIADNKQAKNIFKNILLLTLPLVKCTSILFEEILYY